MIYEHLSVLNVKMEINSYSREENRSVTGAQGLVFKSEYLTPKSREKDLEQEMNVTIISNKYPIALSNINPGKAGQEN